MPFISVFPKKGQGSFSPPASVAFGSTPPSHRQNTETSEQQNADRRFRNRDNPDRVQETAEFATRANNTKNLLPKPR